MPGKITLDITGGPMTGRSFAFEEHDTFIFGRDADCHARLDEKDTTASRHHFIMEINPPDARVRDLGSLNGTHVNGTKVGGREAHETAEQGRARKFPEIAVKDGDRLEVGASRFLVKIEVPALCDACGVAISDAERAAAATPTGGRVCLVCRARLAAHNTVLPNAPPPLACKQCGKDVATEVGIGRRGDYLCEACQSQAANDPVAVLVRALMDRARERGEPPPPDIAGYQVTKLLGAGGMGAVYLARRSSDGAPVALKVMLAKVAVDAKLRAMFEREIDVTSKLRHPNIVAFLDRGSAGSAFYLALEFCPGGSVDQLISARGGRLSIAEAMPIAFSALEGLAHAHEQGIVHRDLKPPNILLAAPGVAKVADYGLAKHFQHSGLSGMTMTGAFAGTVDYMPREQITNFKRVLPSSDVWSMGATIYNMLTGMTPRDFPAGADPMQVVLRAPSVPIRARDPHVPARLAEVLDRACAREAKDRHTTGREFLHALQRAF